MSEPAVNESSHLDAFYDDNSQHEYNPQDHDHYEEETHEQMTLREQIRIRKEMEKKQDEAQFTFKPNVNAYKKGHPLANDAVKENRFDKLYGDALKRHMTSQVKVAEDPAKRDKDLTFKPKISTLGAKQSRSSSRDRLGISRGSSQSRESSRERGGASDNEDGQQSRSSSANGRANVRSGSNSRGRSTAIVNTSNSSGTPSRTRGVTKILEEQQMMMTFRPSITKRAKSIDRNEAPNIVERLHDQGKKVQEKIEQKKSEFDQLRMQECTFAPAVVSKNKSKNGVDVTERLLKFEEMKKKKLEEALKKKQEEEAEVLTFKPKISQRAQSPNVSMSLDYSNMTLEERLMTPTKRRNSRAEEDAAKELTFRPKLIAKRAQSPSVSSEYRNANERLYVEGSIHRREQDCKREQIRQSFDKDLTFSPELVSKSRARDSPDENLFERLTNYIKGDPTKIDKIRHDREAELTFQPALTRKSHEIGARTNTHNTPIYERQKAEYERTQAELELRRQQQEEEKLKEVSFTPQVPEASKELARRRSQANIDAGGDAASVFSMSVHSRLASMYTVSSANLSLSGMGDNATIMTESTKQEEPLHPRQQIVLPEEKVNQLVRRLSMHKKVEEPVPEVRAKVMSPQEYEGAVQRLAMQKTMSFTLKTDPAQLEAVQPKLVKEHPKVSQEQMEEILERLQSPTVSAAVAAETPRESPLGNNPLVRTASGRSFSMSTSQYNLFMSHAAAGAAAVHGMSPASSPSPTRRHTLMSPPRASFFGTPLAAIHDVDEHHEESPGVSAVDLKATTTPPPTAAAPNSATRTPARRFDSFADLEVEMVEEEGTDEEEEEENRRRQSMSKTNKKSPKPSNGVVKKPPTKPSPSPRKSVTSSPGSSHTTSATASPKKPVPSTNPVAVRAAPHTPSTQRPTTPTSASSSSSTARRLSAPTSGTPVKHTGIGATTAGHHPSHSSHHTPLAVNRAVPKSTLVSASSGTGEFVDDFERKLQKTMAMLKPLDDLPPVPVPVVPAPVVAPPAPVVLTEATPVAEVPSVSASAPSGTDNAAPVHNSTTSVAGLFPMSEEPSVGRESVTQENNAPESEASEMAASSHNEPHIESSVPVNAEPTSSVDVVVVDPEIAAVGSSEVANGNATKTDATPAAQESIPEQASYVDDSVLSTQQDVPIKDSVSIDHTSVVEDVKKPDETVSAMVEAGEDDDEEDGDDEVDMQASSMSLRSTSSEKKKRKKKKKGGKR